MRLLEYQGKELFAHAGIPVPQGHVAATVDEAVAIMRAHPAPSVVKAQVLIGGRGKAGGIKFCSNAEDVREPAKAILGMRIANAQNPDGEVAKRVWIEQRLDIDKEMYLSITVDRASKRPIVIASAIGGMDIEEVARTNPAAIVEANHRPEQRILALHRARHRERSGNAACHDRAICDHLGQAVCVVLRCGRTARGDQSAGYHRKTASSSLPTPRSSSTIMGFSATKNSQPGKPRSKTTR